MYASCNNAMRFRTSDCFSVAYNAEQDMCAINDPLGQTHSPASSDHYFHSKIVLFCEILKSGDRRTDTTCGNSDHYRP